MAGPVIGQGGGNLATVILTYSAGPGGHISGISPQTIGYGGVGTSVTAVPNLGYTFGGWSDQSMANPRTDTHVISNISVVARFNPSSYILKYSAAVGGHIVGTTPQTVAYGQNGTPVTAVPTTGYIFDSWSNGSGANPRTDTNVTANISLTAMFTPIFGQILNPAPTLINILPKSGDRNNTYTVDVYGSNFNSGYTSISFGSGISVNSTTVNNSIDLTAVISISCSASLGTRDVSVTNAGPGGGTATLPNIFTVNSGSCGGGGGGGNGGGGYYGGGGCVLPYVWSTQMGSCQLPATQQPVQPPAQILGSGVCPAELTVTDKLKVGAHDGQYNKYNGGIVSQVHILQAQINRILALSYNQAAGPVDGRFGPLTMQGVARLQITLNKILKPYPLLKVDGVVGKFTKTAINNSCGGM